MQVPFQKRSVASITAKFRRVIVELEDYAKSQSVRSAFLGRQITTMACERNTVNAEIEKAMSVASKFKDLLG